MGSKYSTIQQHQPLRAPSKWDSSERRFVAQLEEVLDDIYRRFGRLTLKDMGGVLEFQARNAFKVESGGAVQIDAKDGANSFIRLGDGNFNATQSGDVSARTGDFASGLAVGGRPVWHSGNIIVSASQPDEHGVIWLKPVETKNVRYSRPTGPNRNMNWYNSTHSFELDAETADVLLGSTLTYTLTIPLYEIKATERNVVVTATLTKNGQTVALPAYTISRIGQWELQTIQLSAESSVNLASSHDPITLTVSIAGLDTNGLYLQRDMEIALQIRSDSSSGAAQSCSLHWIP